MKKLPASLFALVLALSAVLTGSCTDRGKDAAAETVPPAATAGTEAAQTEPDGPALPDMDFGGKEFLVLAQKHDTYDFFTNFEIYAEAANGEVVNDAVYSRNLALEERYNVKIGQELLSHPETVIRNLVSAGDDVYNLVFLEVLDLPGMLSVPLFRDLNKLPYIDFSRPWWNDYVNEALSIGGKLLYTTSDFMLSDKANTFITIFNKKLAGDFGAGDLYADVYDGSWTIDRMHRIAADVAGDVNGDGVFDGKDRFGMVCGTTNICFVLMTSFGNRMVEKDENDIPRLNMNNEKFIRSLDLVLDTIFNPDIAFINGDYKETLSEAFADNRVMFDFGVVRYLKSRSSTDVDYGVLPLPKFDEQQEEYLTTTDKYGSMLFAVPIINADAEFDGFMLEALSAESSETSLKAYYETACKTKYTYDPESAEMLDIACRGLVYDQVYFYDFAGIT